MTRLPAVIAAAAALVALAPACSNPARSGTIRALTYNVAGLPEGLSGSNPSVNTPLISPRLNPYDLVLVQEDWADPVPPVEGFDFFHDALVSAADHPFKSVPGSPPQGRDPRRPEALVADGLNLLSRYALTDSAHTMWNGCFGSLDTSDGGAADCMALKGFTLTRATLADGVTVDVYDLHGEAGGTARDQQLQADDYAQLADFVNRFSAGRAVILGGDTNLHTDGAHPDASGGADRLVWDAFKWSTGLNDPCTGLPCGDSIDKFAVRSGGGVTLTARSPAVEDGFRRPDGGQLSDHRPTSVLIDWAVG
jgi:hypothetical protein